MMFVRVYRFIFVICILSFAICGCGYTTKAALSPEFKTIHIEPFKNKINFTSESGQSVVRRYSPGIEITLTNALIDRFIIDGHLKVVSRKNADLILSGELIDYRKDAVRYNANHEVEEYRVNIIVNATLQDMNNNQTLWKLENYGGDTSTFVIGDTITSDDAIIRDASFDLVRRIVERTVEVW